MPRKYKQLNPLMPDPASNATPVNAEGRTQAEDDYGSGKRFTPPHMAELSALSQQAVEDGYTAAFSQRRSREQAFRDDPSTGAGLRKETINRLHDDTVTIDDGARNTAKSWDNMMSDDRVRPSWYFGQNRRIVDVAEDNGANPRKTIAASASMSPQNGPDDEFRAVSAMTDAYMNRRRITATEDVHTTPTEAQTAKGAKPEVVMRAGESRQLTKMDSKSMAAATSAANGDKVSFAKGFDGKGFRYAGTEREKGFRTVHDPDYNAVKEMDTFKVPWYDDSIASATPDSPEHAEYEARFWDQYEARRVRQGREADVKAGRTGSETLHGVMDRVDTYGLMGSVGDPTDPLRKHKLLGSRGNVVPDTWVNGIQSGQPMRDFEDSPVPAKQAGSTSRNTKAPIGPNTFAKPKEAAERGGKKLSGDALLGIGMTEAVHRATDIAREPLSQTEIPAMMMQEGPWVSDRLRVADSIDELRKAGVGGGSLAKRAGDLRSGGLEGLKEFRPTTTVRRNAEGGSVERVDTPGSFHRGANDPLDTDSMRVVPGAGSSPSPSVRGLNPAMEAFHARASAEGPGGGAAPAGASDLGKRRAIKAARLNLAREHAQRDGY